MARRYESRLVAHVCYVGSGESRSLPRQEVYVHSVVCLHRSEVHLEYLLTLVEVWQVHVYLPVEASGSEQCLVEHVGAVGRRQYDYAAVGSETVHFYEQRVECVLPLVVASHGGVLASCPSHGVYLVYEDDARSLLLRLSEEVAHAACSHSHEHLHEVRSAHREERHARLTGDSLCQQGLSCSRRTHEQRALRNLSSQIGVFLGFFQKLDNLLHLLLGSRLSGYILERYAQVVAFLVHARLALAHAEHASARVASAHAPHEQYPQRDAEDEWREVYEQVHERVAFLVLIAEVGYLPRLLHFGEIFLKLVHGAELHVHRRLRSHLLRAFAEYVAYVLGVHIHGKHVAVLVHHHALGIAFLHILLELCVCGFLFCRASHGEGVSSASDEEYAE